MDRNYYYRIDREGNIWHEGTVIPDPRFLFLVFRTLKQTPGGLLVRCQGENCFFEIEDVPYVVQDVAFHKSGEGAVRQVDLLFPGGYMETLDPASIRISAEHVLYCTVRKGRFQARFSRNAYFKLIPLLGEDPVRGEYFMEIASIRYPIPSTV